MSKRVYISADYSERNGDRDVVKVLQDWGKDDKHIVEYVDTAQVVSGSVSEDEDCRPCDLKKEFNNQISVSSAVIFVIGDKTASRSAGSSCQRMSEGAGCDCTPYKQNANGTKKCKHYTTCKPDPDGDIGEINTYSYLEHEFRQAVKRNKKIIIVYNSLIKQPKWLPDYMSCYEKAAHPFWKESSNGSRIGDYQFIKTELGYE